MHCFRRTQEKFKALLLDYQVKPGTFSTSEVYYILRATLMHCIREF